MLPDVGHVFLVVGHEDVEGGLWALLWLAPLILLSLANLRTFHLIIIGGRSSPMTTSLPFIDSV
jgi:hypothetical protein